MTTAQSNGPAPRKPLRLWPGVTLAIVLVLGRYVTPVVAPDVEVFSTSIALIGILGGMLCAVAIVVWWLLFSRAPWFERVAAVILMIVGVFATRFVVHESIRGGMMGMMLVIYSVPVLSLALVAWAAATRRLTGRTRRASLAIAILLACVPWTLVRTAGTMGAGSEFHWRWTPTPEQRLLAQANDSPSEPVKPAAPAPAPAPATPEEPPATKTEGTPAAAPAPSTTPAISPAAPRVVEARAEWPGFRGPARDGVIRGVRIETDWSASAPVQMWRRPIGPGWSSFAVHGDLLYTQEQRGEEEIVACYRVSTGEPVWKHRDAVRFWESNGGAGPRATPTLSGGRVYTMGATGVVNALDAASGALVWSKNAAADTGQEVPIWGFSSSPLVVDDVVIVAASSQLVAYDLRTGSRRWMGPPEGGGYSSPHLMTIEGVPQVVLMRGRRTTSFSPADGTVLWEHSGEGITSIVQPASAPGGDVLIGLGDGVGGGGVRRVAVTKGSGKWTLEERWASRGLKPYFNDFVVHKGHAFGFDGSILACIDLENGERAWKGGRYGNGQLVLLSDQDLLLVLSEEGELVLVSATPDKFTEVARFQALNAKTWNHPVVVRDVLLVRNGEEMAAFRLPPARRLTEF